MSHKQHTNATKWSEKLFKLSIGFYTFNPELIGDVTDEKTEKLYFCGKSFDGKRFKNIKEAQSGSPAPPPEKKETRRESKINCL